MDKNKNFVISDGSYRSFFEKSRKIVKKISESFIFDPDRVNPETNLIWDKKFSDSIEEILRNEKELNSFSFYSEEKKGPSLNPPIFLIDPIDGSREFLLDIPECAICISFITNWELNNVDGAHWVWNFRDNTEALMINGDISKSSTRKNRKSEQLLGLVSRREWGEGVFDSLQERYQIKPVGSIANKLMKLALGECDFVYSKSDKNIWDIAAASFILNQMGYEMYGPNGKIKALGESPLEGPLLWCLEENYASLSQLMDV